jgi:ferrochelatase
MSNYLIVNFGGPRSLSEIEPFLKTLLCDQDVVKTSLPAFLHRLIFSYVAHRRAKKIAPDYALIGGKSPIFDDTEAFAELLRKKTGGSVTTFHRYLPATHAQALESIKKAAQTPLIVFPMFPQFSYATTGSIAKFFDEHLPLYTRRKLRWVKSYCGHASYIQAMQSTLKDFLVEKRIEEKETVLLFSAHGLPQKFICNGDIYESECRIAFEKIGQAFPQALKKLSYQSKFGKGEWVRPYTIDVCEKALEWSQDKKYVIFIPLSFTSDHVETLFEVEYQYLPIIRAHGLEALRCPALNLRADWVDAVATLLQDTNLLANSMLVSHD